jgi:hypothetical protein
VISFLNIYKSAGCAINTPIVTARAALNKSGKNLILIVFIDTLY